MLGFEMNLAAGVALHEASALIVILNGMWVGGTGVQRLNTLLELSKDVVSDTVEAFRDLFGLQAGTTLGPLDKSGP